MSEPIRFSEPFPLCRWADGDDILPIRSIYNAAIENRQAGPRAQPADEEEVREWLLATRQSGGLAVAVNKGSCIGFASCTPYSRRSQRHLGSLIVHVGVDHRSRGVGTALLEFLFDDPVRLGFRKLVARARADQTAAQRLYHRFGFTEAGRLRDQIRWGDDYYDLLILERFL